MGRMSIQQMDEIGVKSLGIVLLTGLFTGMVLALQSSVQLKTFGATMYIGNLVSASMIRELGPVLAGLMVAGRVGSGIAAQLGSMRVTEQIDALNTLGTDPIKKLVTPRVIAALIMVPVLTVINDFVGIIGGNIIAAFVVGLPTAQYWRTVWDQIASDGFVAALHPERFHSGTVEAVRVRRDHLDHGVLLRAGHDRRNGRRGAEHDAHGRDVEHSDSDRRLLHHAAAAVGAVVWLTRARSERRPAIGGRSPRDPLGARRPTRSERNGARTGARAARSRYDRRRSCSSTTSTLAFDVPILEDVSFVARARARRSSSSGESGTGKSTILKLILRLLVPESGRVLIDGDDITHLSFEEALLVRQKMGMVFQGAALFDSMTVFENVAYPLREHTEMTEDEIEARVREKLQFVDLDPDRVDGAVPVGAVGRHAEARRHRARHGEQSGDHALRRADVGARSADDRRRSRG